MFLIQSLLQAIPLMVLHIRYAHGPQGKTLAAALAFYLSIIQPFYHSIPPSFNPSLRCSQSFRLKLRVTALPHDKGILIGEIGEGDVLIFGEVPVVVIYFHQYRLA